LGPLLTESINAESPSHVFRWISRFLILLRIFGKPILRCRPASKRGLN
jgi:hypothetical protein